MADDPVANLRIARTLREIAILLRLERESAFKARAYERAAYALEQGTQDLDELIESGQLTSIPGVGNRLGAVIEEIHRSGSSRLLERLRARFPPGTVELIGVPHLGLRKIAALHAALGISSRDSLRTACEAGLVARIPGFGARTEEKILAALKAPRSEERSPLLIAALAEAKPLIAYLRRCPQVVEVGVAGAMRRCAETVEAIEVVAATHEPAAVLDELLRYPSSVATLSRSAGEATLRLLSGPSVTLHVVPPAAYVVARHHRTGSREHIAKLQEWARRQGLTLDGTRLRTAAGEGIAIANESDLYRRLGLEPIPPELREDQGEVEAAADGSLPRDLVRLRDIAGAVHVHTVYSDGRNTIEEMAIAAEALGLRYLTITDHSPSASYASGVTLDRLQSQWEEMARVQERVAIRLLRGTESDILRDGALDYPDAVLEQFDVIIASIHARYRLDASEMTARIRRAMEFPVFKIWGHPLGRLLNKRPPVDCDVPRILDAIAGARAAIEINGDPYRLDLEPKWIREARRRGIQFVLSTDAHSINGLRNLRFAVSMARRGWVRRGEVLNALPVDEFRAAVRPAASAPTPSADPP